MTLSSNGRSGADTSSKSPGPAEERRDHVASLAKGLAVLEALASSPEGLSLSGVAGATGFTRASVRRLLLTLVSSGYVEQENRLFRAGSGTSRLAGRQPGDGLLWRLAEPYLQAVSRRLDESCSAAILDGEWVLYVARVAAARIMSVDLAVGTRLPALYTAMGRVILAGMPSGEVERYLAKSKIRPPTSKAVRDRAGLMRMIDTARQDGYALMDEELEIGLRSIAVPISIGGGQVIAGLNVSAQAARVSIGEMVEAFLPRLRQAADEIGALAQRL